MNLSKKLFILGTKNKMHKNTTGHAIMNRSNHKIKNFSEIPIFNNIINNDTKVLVQNDIKKAKI